MSRTATIFVGLVVLMALSVGAAVVVFPGESIWLMLAMAPAALLAMLVVNLRPPADGMLRFSQPPPSRSVPVRGMAGIDRWRSAVPQVRQGLPPDPRAGIWTGSLRVRLDSYAPSEILPVRLALNESGYHAAIAVSGKPAAAQSAVTSLDVIEHDPHEDVLFFRVGMSDRAAVTFGLRRAGDEFVSVDETAAVVAEIRRVQPSTPGLPPSPMG